jgi:hypothetical protein
MWPGHQPSAAAEWSHWNADDVDDLQTYVADKLGEAAGILIFGSTGFLRKGTPSAGVRREYSGTAGRSEIPQRGYPQSARRLRRLRHHPRTHLVDRELYLPSPGRTTVIAVAPPPDTGRHRRRLRARRPEVSAGAAGSASNAEACPPPCPNL